MRLLLTGAGGRVGGRLASLLHADGFEVLAAYRSAAPPQGPRGLQLALDSNDALARLLDRERPVAIVHAAALAQVERCFEHPDAALAANTQLPDRIARVSRQRGLRLITLSTDLVFSGERAPLVEGDEPRPRSVYGRTKLAGEEAVLVACPGAAVVRLALVIGRGHGLRPSASEAVVWALRRGERPLLFGDEYRTPIDPESVAAAIERLLQRGGAGRYHLGGSERLSRFELGQRVSRALGLDPARLLLGRQADRPASEPRPADVSLDSTRASRELGWVPRPLDEALAESRAQPE